MAQILSSICQNLNKGLFTFLTNPDQDTFDYRVAIELLNKVERASNFVFFVEETAAPIGSFLDSQLRNANSVSRLMIAVQNRLQLFDSYRQMLERRVEDCREIKHIISKNPNNCAVDLNRWFTGKMSDRISFELEIKLFQYFFPRTNVRGTERLTAGSVMMFDYDDLIAA